MKGSLRWTHDTPFAIKDVRSPSGVFFQPLSLRPLILLSLVNRKKAKRRIRIQNQPANQNSINTRTNGKNHAAQVKQPLFVRVGPASRCGPSGQRKELGSWEPKGPAHPDPHSTSLFPLRLIPFFLPALSLFIILVSPFNQNRLALLETLPWRGYWHLCPNLSGN